MSLERSMRQYRRGQPPFDAPFTDPFVLPEWWDSVGSAGNEEIVALATILCDIVPHAAEIERVFAGAMPHACCDASLPRMTGCCTSAIACVDAQVHTTCSAGAGHQESGKRCNMDVHTLQMVTTIKMYNKQLLAG